jgi:hypothetical protein
MSSGRCQDDDAAEEIRNVLSKQYPFDAATGYKVGELHGAVSIKQPLGNGNQ